MTNAQKLTIKISEKESRVSEIRARLNSIEGLSESELTAEVRSEQSGLVGEFGTVDGELIALRNQHTAALIAEGNEEAEKRGDFGAGDGESAEVRALRSRVTITDYLNPAAGGAGLYGAAAELNSALEVPLVGKSGGVPIPWAVLAGPVQEVRQGENGGESRAFTDTGDYAGGISSRTILQRLFAPGIMDLLGVRMDSVPTGRTEWPLLTGGVAPDQAVEGAAAADAVSATFSTETLKPKRLTGKYEFTHEQAAQVPDIEQALRRDLADAVKSKMSALILAGDEGTNAQEPDGFLTKIAAPGDPGAVAVFGRLHRSAFLRCRWPSRHDGGRGQRAFGSRELPACRNRLPTCRGRGRVRYRGSTKALHEVCGFGSCTGCGGGYPGRKFSPRCR